MPGTTFSSYDRVLDMVAVPARFRDLGLSAVDTYFAAARGRDGVAPLEPTKWFDTNYHYLVPELEPSTRFALTGDKPVAEFREALDLGVTTRPVLPGPVAFLLPAKASATAPPDFAPLDLLGDLGDALPVLTGRALRYEGTEIGSAGDGRPAVPHRGTQ